MYCDIFKYVMHKGVNTLYTLGSSLKLIKYVGIIQSWIFSTFQIHLINSFKQQAAGQGVLYRLLTLMQ